MRDIEDSHSKLAIELGKQAQDFRLGDGIQSTRSLIGDKERRPVKDCHSDDDALGLAHAQLGWAAAQKIAVVRETDVRQRSANCGGTFFSRSVSVSAPGFAELRADTEDRIERGQ